MNTDNQPTPDDGYRNAWKQVFDDASETPPPRVWNAIERQLQTDDRARIVPLWWASVQPWATGMAAAVALVLLGWWSWPKLATKTPDVRSASGVVAARQPGAKQSAKKPEPANRIALAKTTPLADPASASSQSSTRSYQPKRIPSGQNPVFPTGVLPSADSLETLVRLTQAERQAAPLANGIRVGQPTTVSRTVAPAVSQVALVQPAAPALTGFGQVNSNAVTLTRIAATDESERFQLAVDELTGKPFRNRQPGIQRVVWFRNEDPLIVAPEQSTTGGREKWASVSVMPSAYNPVAAIPVLPMSAALTTAYSYAYSNATRYDPLKATSTLRSESGAAVAVQASAGAQFNDRWSVETGVGYLQARSTVISPTQVVPLTLNNKTGRTLYTAVVQNSLTRQTNLAGANAAFDQSASIPTGLYASQAEGRTRSDYNFVQVPVEVGYQLRPRRKLGLSLLGGLLTNWFVRNSVGETLVVKPSDNVYRSLTLSGTAGARFRYRSTRRWSASLAGIYQQSLQVGTLSDVSLETRPHTVGVSFGMDYHF